MISRIEVAAVVYEELANRGVAVEQTLHGFEWNNCRLQSGGGIAGNSYVWWITNKRAPDIILGDRAVSIGPFETIPSLREALKRAAEEYLAKDLVAAVPPPSTPWPFQREWYRHRHPISIQEADRRNLDAIVAFNQVESVTSGDGFVVMIVRNNSAGLADRFDVINISCKYGKCITVGRELNIVEANEVADATRSLNRSIPYYETKT